jgi:hypothetical protein
MMLPDSLDMVQRRWGVNKIPSKPSQSLTPHSNLPKNQLTYAQCTQERLLVTIATEHRGYYASRLSRHGSKALGIQQDTK